MLNFNPNVSPFRHLEAMLFDAGVRVLTSTVVSSVRVKVTVRVNPLLLLLEVL